jgi:hypothetical protein
MCYWNHDTRSVVLGFIIFCLLFPVSLAAETKTWTGYGGDRDWQNPLNWSGSNLPQPADDVLLDNRDMPVSYSVNLPVSAVTLRTIRIAPSPGRNIELVLPATSIITNALAVTGPGYGIELDAGAIFRNASGLSSGESITIADSMIIHDGGRYIHQTRASHANSILRLLSTAPGTEQGIFEFDVPRASYTISASNRTYGSLELHAAAFGSMVNYTCTGANPLHIRGNLRIGHNVSMSMDLSGMNGNVQIDGDYIQEGGLLNLASGSGDNTVLRVKGDLYQFPEAIITETNNGNPFIELNGNRSQEIAMAGRILNQVGFRSNNTMGSVLRLPLTLPWILDLQKGAITSSASCMLILDTGCSIIIDSSRQAGVYINGPQRKLGLNGEDHFLFPVGKLGNLRWLELKNASGNYTVEYMHQDPASLGNNIGPGLDHISKLEFWSVTADGPINNQAKIELSFASALSGGVTDPAFLNIAKFQAQQWEDAGHTAVTGNFIQGSVVSENTDFTASDYTLASILDLENPLPSTSIDLQVKEISEKPFFSWTLESAEIPDHFELYEESGNPHTFLTSLKAVFHQKQYVWTGSQSLTSGVHFFSVRMIDIHGKEYAGARVMFKKEGGKTRLFWIPGAGFGGNSRIMIQSDKPEVWQYEIITMDGRCVYKGILKLEEGMTYLPLNKMMISRTAYIFRALDASCKNHHLVFRND